MKIILLVMLIGYITPTIQLPDEYDLAQDARFNRYIQTDSELARIVVKDIEGIRQGVKYMTAILGAIGIMLLGLIGSWLKKRLKL